MKTTVELPDELFRKAKSFAALRGIKFKDLVQEGLQRIIEADDLGTNPQKPRLYDLMKDACGIVSSGVSDLATNPKYMKEFGRE